MSVPNSDQLDQIRAELDRVTGERDALAFELMEKRTDLRTVHHYLTLLQQEAADHPSLVARLTAEVEEWATRCGTAEAERDEWQAKYESLADTDLTRRLAVYEAGRRNPFAASS